MADVDHVCESLAVGNSEDHTEKNTGHLSGANPLIYRMDDSNAWRSVHRVGET